jgi:hypothetical protein
MKRLLIGSAALALVACGGSSSSGGGGSVGGGTTTVAYVVSPTTATCFGQSASLAGVVVLHAENREIANACTTAIDACIGYPVRAASRP